MQASTGFVGSGSLPGTSGEPPEVAEGSTAARTVGTTSGMQTTSAGTTSGSGSGGIDPRGAPTPFEESAFAAPFSWVLDGWGPGSAWADIDGDGLLDLITAGGHATSHVYINQGDGTFAIWAGDAQLAALDSVVGISIADYDNDGWADIYALRLGANALLRNLGGGELDDVTVTSALGDGQAGVSAAWADYDGDSWLDLHVSNANNDVDALFHARGDGTFERVSYLLNQFDDYQSFSAIWLDHDNDGDLDLYVSNDKQVGNRLWRNDGPGCLGWCFVDVGAQEGAAQADWSMGLAAGDYDGDLDLDVVFTDIGDADLLRNLRTEGTEGFVHASAEAGLGALGVGWGVLMFDYDNDGALDLYFSDGLTALNWPNRLYHNNADGTFDDVTWSSGCSYAGASYGAAYADYDEDGSLDIAIASTFGGHRIYHGTAQHPQRHWLTVDLVGGGPVNRDAIGARVWVTTDAGRTLMQEVMAGSSVASSNMRRLHFGLGDEHLADVIIRWPDGLLEHPALPNEDSRWVKDYPIGF